MDEEMNPVFQLLKGLIEQADQQVYYRGAFYALGAADTPHGCTLAFVRSQLRELDAQVKETLDKAAGTKAD